MIWICRSIEAFYININKINHINISKSNKTNIINSNNQQIELLRVEQHFLEKRSAQKYENYSYYGSSKEVALVTGGGQWMLWK